MKNHVFFDKVIDAITQILTLCGTNAEDVNSLDMIAALGSRIVCLSCPPAIVMNFKTMVCILFVNATFILISKSKIRHCKRHDENNFMILASEDLHMGHFPIEYGVAADLLSSFPDSEKRRALRIYGCRHCQEIRQFFKKIPAPLQDPQTHSRNRLALKNKVYNFDGLRSHAKEKYDQHSPSPRYADLPGMSGTASYASETKTFSARKFRVLLETTAITIVYRYPCCLV